VILPDVNVLAYAYRSEGERHAAYAGWLNGVLAGDEDLALADHCLAGFVRIVTNRRIVPDPAPTSHALSFVDALRGAARARSVASTPATWATFAELVAGDRGIAGNLVPDAYLAALAMSHGCRLATADRGFARFPGLDHFDPAA
jgi:uncharacterized protein